MASQVQRNFLPRQLPNTDKVRWASIFKPADWVSGDIFDITRLDEENMGFYIADAVGHSMPAALLTMFLKQAITMRETTGNQYRIFRPAQVIANLNDRMVQQELAGCLFATCCYCLLDTETLALTFARGGHPYPILIPKGKPPQQIECRGGLLGVFEEGEFEEKTVQLAQGDKVFIYSDGCESLVGNCDEKSEFVFTESFVSACELDVEKMLQQFDELVTKLKPKPGEKDDMTAVGLEIF